MIDEYNSGVSNIENFFAKLTAFAKKLSEEERRGISEQLTEERDWVHRHWTFVVVTSSHSKTDG
jgi:hypothetical protein